MSNSDRCLTQGFEILDVTGGGGEGDILLEWEADYGDMDSSGDPVWQFVGSGSGSSTYTVLDDEVRFRLRASWTATRLDGDGQPELFDFESFSVPTPLAICPPYTVTSPRPPTMRRRVTRQGWR